MFVLGGLALIIAATAIQARARVSGGRSMLFIATGLTALVLTAGVAALVSMRGPAQPPQTGALVRRCARRGDRAPVPALYGAFVTIVLIKDG